MSLTSLKPRTGASLDYFRCFDEGCVKTRRNDLIRGFIAQLERADMLKMADKARRAFKPIPMFKLPEDKNRWETYGEKATKLAEAVIEQEKQNYVDARVERDIELIKSVAKRLQYQVWIVEDGKPVKLKMGIEKANVSDHKGGWTRQDVLYVGDHDTESLQQIFRLKHQLTKLKDFVPYYPDEVKEIYEEALSLADLEVV
jgi:hypothetical protein